MSEDVFAVLEAGGDGYFVLVAAQADDGLAPRDVGRASGVVYMTMLERSRTEVSNTYSHLGRSLTQAHR